MKSSISQQVHYKKVGNQMENKHEYAEKMLEKAMRKINGKTLYDSGVIGEMNKNGVFFHFTNDGVWYQFTPYTTKWKNMVR